MCLSLASTLMAQHYFNSLNGIAGLCSGLSDKSQAINGLLISLQVAKTRYENKKRNDLEALSSDSVTYPSRRYCGENPTQWPHGQLYWKYSLCSAALLNEAWISASIQPFERVTFLFSVSKTQCWNVSSNNGRPVWPERSQSSSDGEKQRGKCGKSWSEWSQNEAGWSKAA